MRVLLTGAFGNIGGETLQALLEAGHEVRAFDLASDAARAAARALDRRIEPHWGDISDPTAVKSAVAGCDAVIHDAAILPPASERNPALLHRVNVEGTRHLISACEAADPKPRLVLASSVSVYGPSRERQPPVRADDPVRPTDHYSTSKVECEEMLRASTLDWVILRFGGVIPDAPSAGQHDPAEFFARSPDCRLEYVHPSDAALAQVRAVECAEAGRKVLLIGGGPRCQITLGELGDAMLEAAGIGTFPRSCYGDAPFYTDWMDTEESQRLLGYQRHGFGHFKESAWRRMRATRMLVRPLRGPVRWWMLRQRARSGVAHRP